MGIGTAFPGQKLSVAGTIESTLGGFMFPDGTVQTTAAGAGGGGGPVQQLISNFTVAPGSTITAGDVVGYINGLAAKGFTAGSTVTYGAEYVIPARTVYPLSAITLSSTKFVVMYRLASNNAIYMTVGEITGNSIVYSQSPGYVADSGYTASMAAMSSTRIVVAGTGYQSGSWGSGYYYGWVNAYDVVGTSLNYVAITSYQFIQGQSKLDDLAVAGLSQNSFVIAYDKPSATPRVTQAMVGTISGSTISFNWIGSVQGAGYTFNPGQTSAMSMETLSPTKFLIAYSDVANSYYGTAIIGDVQPDTSIVFGAETVFNSTSTGYIATSLLSSSRVAMAYVDSGFSGRVIIGDVSGNTIALGTPQTFNASGTSRVSIDSLSPTRLAVSYEDGGNLGYATLVIGDVTGSTVAFSSEQVFLARSTPWPTLAALSSSRLVVLYFDYSHNLAAGTIGDVGGSAIGIARQSGSPGQTIPVIVSGISDVHAGLVPGIVYYADSSGSITATPTRWRVGLAISATSILLDSDRDNLNQYFGDMVFANAFRITEASTYEGLVLKNQLDRSILTVSEQGDLSIAGSLASQGLTTAIRRVTGTYNVGGSDSIVVCDASTGAFSVTLPSAARITGRQYTIKKTDPSRSVVTVTPIGTERIDGSLTHNLSAQWKYLTVVSDGANWLIVAGN